MMANVQKTNNAQENVYDRLAREALEYEQFIDTSDKNQKVVQQWNSINDEIMYLRNDWKVLNDLKTFLNLAFPAYISESIKTAKKSINYCINSGTVNKDEANLLDWEVINIKSYALNYNVTTPLGIIRRDAEGVHYVFFAQSALEKYVKPILNSIFPGRIIDIGKGYYSFNLKGLTIEEVIEKSRLALSYVEKLLASSKKNIEEGYGITIVQLEKFKCDSVRFDEPSGEIKHIGTEPDWDKNWSVQFEPFVGMDQYYMLTDGESRTVLSRK